MPDLCVYTGRQMPDHTTTLPVVFAPLAFGLVFGLVFGEAGGPPAGAFTYNGVYLLFDGEYLVFNEI